MTTKIQKELALNLCENPSWPMFSAKSSKREKVDADLAAFTLKWKGDGPNVTELVADSARTFEGQLLRVARNLGLGLQTLIVHETLQPRSAAVLYRKLWKSSLVPAAPIQLERGPELEVSCGDRVRVAALATVPMEAIPWVIAAIDAFDVIVPLLLRSPLALDEESVRSLVKIGFPPDGCSAGASLDWVGLVREVSQAKGIVIRRTRNLAESAVSVDFFGHDDDVRQVAFAMEDDNQ